MSRLGSGNTEYSILRRSIALHRGNYPGAFAHGICLPKLYNNIFNIAIKIMKVLVMKNEFRVEMKEM